MTPYPKYKPSGIEWIGDIPEQWEVKRLKYLGEAIIGITYSPDDVSDEEHGILVLRSSNIQDSKLAFNDCVYIKKKIPQKLIVIAGDILICARNGSAHLVGKNACIDEANAGVTFGAFMSIFRTKYWRFISCFLNSGLFTAQTGLYSTSTINQLTSDILNNMQIAFPVKEDEQTKIATFLDKKTSQIDLLISNKQRLISLLKEEKTAIINEAVTKGINKKAKLKPSGTEWLGDVPEHWEVKKLKYVVKSVQTGNTPPSGKSEYYDDGNFDWFTPSDFSDSITLDHSKRKLSELAVKDEIVNVFEKNTVLLVGIGATLGKVGICSSRCSSNQQVNAITFNDNFEPLFGAYYFKAQAINIVSLANAATLAILNQAQTKDIPIPCPPLMEQKRIVQLIAEKFQKIDHAVSRIEKEIELMQEYRTALISEVVTGKVRVEE